MPGAYRDIRRKGLQTKGFWLVVPLLAMALGTGGCLVTTSRYDAKTKEADSLRDALALTNKEKNTLEAKYVAIQKQVSDEKEANAVLSARVAEQEEELGQAREDLASIARKYEGTRITRDELISELLEKEKATGKRIQELSEMAQACDTERGTLRKKSAGQEAAISRLEEEVAQSPDMESLRRERDILLGRIERIREERLQEGKRRELAFAELAKTFSGISPRISAAPVGPAMRVRIPDTVLFAKGKSTLTDAGRNVIGEVGKAASDFPESVLIVTAGGKPKTDEILGLLTKAQSAGRERMLAGGGSTGGETELLLVIP